MGPAQVTDYDTSHPNTATVPHSIEAAPALTVPGELPATRLPAGDGMQDAWTHVLSNQEGEVLPMGHLQRFAGFRYVARVQLRRPSPQHFQEDPHHTPGGRARRRYAQSVTDNPGQLPPSFLRVTREGHVYVSSGLPASDATPGSGAQQQTFEEPSEEATLGGGAAAEVGASTRRGRSLMAVFDGDQRSECPHLPTYPFSGAHALPCFAGLNEPADP